MIYEEKTYKWNLLQLIYESLQTPFPNVYQRANGFRYNDPNASTEYRAATEAFSTFKNFDADQALRTRLKDK